MLPGEVLDKFIERCPAAVMVRATVERLLRPERLDEIFEAPRSRQSEREIVCSKLVALMVGVATRTHQNAVPVRTVPPRRVLRHPTARLDADLPLRAPSPQGRAWRDRHAVRTNASLCRKTISRNARASGF